MIINITRQHIKKGQQFSFYACPIALGLKEAGFRRPYVTVFTKTKDAALLTYSNDKGKPFVSYAVLPRSVTRFVRRFDAGKSVKPFRFRVNA